MKNVGSIDRLLRLTLVGAVALAWYFGWISGTWAIVLGIVAAVLLLTSLFSFCPAYTLIGVSTRKG